MFRNIVIMAFVAGLVIMLIALVVEIATSPVRYAGKGGPDHE